MKKLLVLLSLISSVFVACKTDFELNAAYKETTVIYGLLDQSRNVQMIKVNKAFLGAGDANAFAQNSDSVNYNPADLSVYVEELKNGTVVRTITFHDSVIASKKPGDFTTAKNIIYVSYAPLDSVDFTKIYKLYVINHKTGNIATASTGLLEKTKYTKPATNNNYVSFVNSPSSPSTNGVYSDLATGWTTKRNARTYQTNIRFYYNEKDLTTNITTLKYIDWLQAPKESASLNGGESIIQNVSGQGFYQLLGNVIPEDANVIRHCSHFVFTMTTGADDLNNYINVTAPSGDLNQDKPTFTNIDNGIGIFSSRNSYSMIKYICNDTIANPRLCNSTTVSLKELVEGKYTYKLKFQY